MDQIGVGRAQLGPPYTDPLVDPWMVPWSGQGQLEGGKRDTETFDRVAKLQVEG